MGLTPIRSTVLLAAAVVTIGACGASSARSASAPASAAVGTPTPAGSTGRTAAGIPSSSTGGVASAGGSGAAPSATPVSSGVLGAAVTPTGADIVQTGTIDLRLHDPATLRRAFHTISGLAGPAGGYVSGSTLRDGRDPTGSVTLRIPDATLGGVVVRIGGLGRVTGQTLSGRDVTGEVVDLGVEIRNLSSEESAVRALLSNAGSVRNILTIQQQLFTLQDEIQQLTAQSNTLDNRVQYATVTVALTTTVAAPTPHRPPRPPSAFERFWTLARTHTVDVVRSAFLAVGWAMPALVAAGVAAVAWLTLRRVRRPAVVAPGGGAPDPE